MGKQKFNDVNLEIVGNVNYGVSRVVDNLANGQTGKVDFDLGSYTLTLQTKKKRKARAAVAPVKNKVAARKGMNKKAGKKK